MSRWPREQEGQNSASIVSKSLSWRSAESCKNTDSTEKRSNNTTNSTRKRSTMSLTVLLYSIYSENSRRFANSSKALENKRKYMRNYETWAFETDDFDVKIYINQNIHRAAVYSVGYSRSFRVLLYSLRWHAKLVDYRIQFDSSHLEADPSSSSPRQDQRSNRCHTRSFLIPSGVTHAETTRARCSAIMHTARISCWL